MAFKIADWSSVPELSFGRSHLSFSPDDFRRREISFPSPYVSPTLQYVNLNTPPFSTVDNPFTCPATDLLKLDHLHNPMMIFGQPFTGKTCLFMKLTTQANAYYGPKHWIRLVDLRVAAINCISTGKWPKDIIELLADQLNMTESSLRDLFKPLPNAKELIRKKKFDKLTKGELFLDGFDEIPAVEREYFLKLLPQLKQKRQECPIRVWISCRTYFKGRLVELLGDESSFEILGYSVEQQKHILFNRWKDVIFPKKIKKYEEDRLWQYTHVMYNEFCKEVKTFEVTFGACPLYLEVISSIFNNHAINFMKLYKKVRQDERAGPTGDYRENTPTPEEEAPPVESLSNESEVVIGQSKKKKKKAASACTNGCEETSGTTPSSSAAVTASTAGTDIGDGVNAPTTQLMCQIAGIFTAEFLEYLVLTVVDVYCLKHLYMKDLTDAECQKMLEREYRRATHLYAQYAIKTFPSYQFETLIPNVDNDAELGPNLSLLVDEELHHIGFLIVEGENCVVQLTHKLIGDFFLAKYFGCNENMKVRDSYFDNFYLRVFLFDGEAKSARSFYDNILTFSAISLAEYRPEILHDFLLRQYKLDDDAGWERIRNDGSVWHLAVMEGFHRTAMIMVNCFHPENEREQIRKLLKIRVPMEIYEGGRTSATVWRVHGSSRNHRHLVSALSLVAMFAYSESMEELLRTIVRFYTPEDLREEFTYEWSFMHYAAMHSNLWFIMHLYNDMTLPAEIRPPVGSHNHIGQLPIHLLMSYSWFHIMILRDYFILGYDKLGGCASLACRRKLSQPNGTDISNAVEGSEDKTGDKTETDNANGNGNESEDENGEGMTDGNGSENVRVACCSHHKCAEEPNGEHKHFREIISYRDMIKELHGPGNLLRLSHHECIRLMVQLGGDDIDAPESFTGNTILHYAVIDGCLETIKYLLDLGAFIEPKNKELRTPLFFAGMYGHRQVFMCLVKRGAKATAKDSQGLTPITMWTRHGARLDKARNEPMSNEDMHFFKACADIDKIMQDREKASAKAAAEEKAVEERQIKEKENSSLPDSNDDEYTVPTANTDGKHTGLGTLEENNNDKLESGEPKAMNAEDDEEADIITSSSEDVSDQDDDL